MAKTKSNYSDKTMFLFTIILLLVVKLVPENASNGDECCYLYGSEPRNESNCVPEGNQFSLNFVIYSPRDKFTSLTVRWFKSNTVTEAITNDSTDEYILMKINTSVTQINNNCSHGMLHRETFTLHIRNFTTTKNGYYWCQIVVNGSLLQPSQDAWFYADSTGSCRREHHFIPANEAQCATYSTRFPPIIFTTATTPTIIRATDHNNTQSTTSKETDSSNQPISYVIGTLSTLILFFGTFVVLILVMIMHKRHGEHKQRSHCGKTRSQTEPVDTSDLHSPAAIHLCISNTSSGSREDGVINFASVGSTAIEIDNKPDHTYDTAEYHKQVSNCYNEQPQYNTLQHGNCASTQTNPCSPIFDAACYDEIDINTSNNVQNCSTLTTHIQRGTHKTNPGGKYDHVDSSQNHPLSTTMNGSDRTNQMIPQDYKPVYHESNYTQVTGKHVLFDDETYGMYKPASKGATVQLGVDRVESTPYFETIGRAKEELLTPDKEVEYAEPLPPNTKLNSHAQATGEHFYYSLEHNEPMKPEENISGVHYSNESSNPVMKDGTFASNSNYFSEDKLTPKDEVTGDAKCQTQTLTSLYDSTHAMDEVGTTLNAPILFNIDQCQFDDPMYEGISHSVPKHADKNPPLSLDLFHEKMQTKHNDYASSPEEESCIGDLNDDPDLLNHEEDMNAPEYSDPIDSEHLDDNNIAKDQRDPKVNIYDTFDDLVQ